MDGIKTDGPLEVKDIELAYLTGYLDALERMSEISDKLAAKMLELKRGKESAEMENQWTPTNKN